MFDRIDNESDKIDRRLFRFFIVEKKSTAIDKHVRFGKDRTLKPKVTYHG